jgi:hypothetical protein
MKYGKENAIIYRNSMEGKKSESKLKIKLKWNAKTKSELKQIIYVQFIIWKKFIFRRLRKQKEDFWRMENNLKELNAKISGSLSCLNISTILSMSFSIFSMHKVSSQFLDSILELCEI